MTIPVPPTDPTAYASYVKFKTTSQSLTPGALVELFQLDLTGLFDRNGSPGGLAYFTTNTYGGSAIAYQGNIYEPIEIKADGFEYNARGTLPSPKVTLGNANGVIAAAVIAFNDLVGAKFTRIKVQAQYLDGMPEADPNCHYPPDIYYIDQKTSHNKNTIEFKLLALMDQRGKKLPGRQVLRRLCFLKYRVFNAGTGQFVYDNSDMACPYNGSQNGFVTYDINGQITSDLTKDVCSKILNTGCYLRFPSALNPGGIPFGGFPGAGRFLVQS